jgi:dTDP-4-dehydrorhamnose 3,5-epimerase
VKIAKTRFQDVLVIEPKVYEDTRGFFVESYNQKEFQNNGLNVSFVQDNLSHSKRNVLRGLHYQITHPQGKLVRVVSGEIFDVVVDVRIDSPQFGKWDSIILSAENRRSIWIPEGFAHGFMVLSESADVLYKTTDYYHAEGQRCILWNDPMLDIGWPVRNDLIISDQDLKGSSFKGAEIFA